MTVPVYGLQNSRFGPGVENRKYSYSPAGSLSAYGVSNVAFIAIDQPPAGTVAVIDRIIAKPSIAPGATTHTLTLAFNGGTMILNQRGVAGVSTSEEIVINAKGSIVVDGTTLTMVASTINEWQVTIEWRMMTKIKAMQSGFMPGVPFVVSSAANITAATPVDLLSEATVTAIRGVEIRGITITGAQTNAAAGAAKEVLLEFTGVGATVNRKLAKNTYGTADLRHQKPLVIGHGRFRGPKGYGVRATFGETDNPSNARVCIWGFFYTDAQRTFPGTGLIPGASDSLFDPTDLATGGNTKSLGDYFWYYHENTTNGGYNLLPLTTIPVGSPGRLSTAMHVDGVAITIAGPNNSATAVNLGFGDVPPPATGSSAMAVTSWNGVDVAGAGATTQVYEDLALVVRGDFGLTINIINLLSTADKVGVTVWGRWGGRQPGSRGQDNFREATLA